MVSMPRKLIAGATHQSLPAHVRGRLEPELGCERLCDPGLKLWDDQVGGLEAEVGTGDAVESPRGVTQPGPARLVHRLWNTTGQVLDGGA
jgi:hypothetical protein